MQFYTMGSVALEGEWARQYDWPALHEQQTRLVPGSEPYHYRPAYPPLVAAVYAPFAVLPFRTAYAAWAIAAAVWYALLIGIAAAETTVLTRRVAVPAALLFPPFIALVLTGQSTLLPLTGFVLGCRALQQGRATRAGLAFALVALKPQFGLALAAVLLLTRAWPVLRGVAAGGAVLALVTLLVCGPEAMAAWWSTSIGLAGQPSLVEPSDARHTHALRMTLEAVLPGGVAVALWIAVAAATVLLAAHRWRASPSASLRVAALLLGTVIVSPHVLAYDAVLLAPACLWLADRAIRTGQIAVLCGVALLAVLFVVPDARVLGVPLTVPLGLWLMHRAR